MYIKGLHDIDKSSRHISVNISQVTMNFGLPISMVTACILLQTSTAQQPYVLENFRSNYDPALSSSKIIRLNNEQRTCGLNQPCSIAICPWQQDILDPSHHACTFISTPCTCPPNSQCSMAETIAPSAPESTVTTFNFGCVPQ